MGDPSRRLHHELKMFRNLLRPAGEHPFGGYSIEGIVYFDGREVPGVKLEHFFCRELRRVETALPLLVRPPTGAYEDFHLTGDCGANLRPLGVSAGPPRRLRPFRPAASSPSCPRKLRPALPGSL